MSCFLLPQVKIDSFSLPTEPLLLVSGGRAPSVSWLRSVAAGKKIWCIDHGIDICYTADLVPELLIGDFDSALPQSLKWASMNNVEIQQFPRAKDLTDTQLALKKAADRPILLTGAFGGRLDHLFSTVHFAADNNQVIIADEQELLLPLRGAASLTVTFIRRPLAISLLSLTPDCQEVTTNGLRWELNHALLSQSMPYTVSNELKNDADKIKVNVAAGILGVYACWD